MSKIKDEQKKIEYRPAANPFEVFNENFSPVDICKGSKNFEPAPEGKNIIVKGGETAFEWNKDKGHYYTVINDNGWQKGVLRTPYKLLALLSFNKYERHAQTFVRREYMNENSPYILVGTDYFKKITTMDNGVQTQDLKAFNRQTLKDLEGKAGLNHVLDYASYDDFTIEPSNTDYKQVVGRKYNLYSKFPHQPHPEQVSDDDIPATVAFMEHIFGDQVKYGFKYMKVLYERPKQVLPVLCLVSKDRNAGKSTFLNWLRILFGNNFTQVPPENLSAKFNSSYAYSNIVATDEAFFDKAKTVERIKALATQPKIQVDKKFVSAFEIPWYGKLLICTNKEKDFMRIDREEVRFWVRRPKEVPKDELDTELDDKLRAEIPKLLRYLNDCVDVEYGRSRMVFKEEEIANDELEKVKQESRSWLLQDLEIEIESWFNSNPTADRLYLDVKAIKQHWFEHNNRARLNKIRKVLKDEMQMESEDMGRYSIMGAGIKKPCKPYLLHRHDYVEGSEKAPEAAPDTELKAVPF